MVHRHGMVTWPYTVDDPNRMRALIDLGVDGIITNRPDVLVDVLAQPARCALTA
jgi:glycerophosphoryl diester phosphodiesterase